MIEYYNIRLARIQTIIDYIFTTELSDKRYRQLSNFCQLQGIFEQRLWCVTR